MDIKEYKQKKEAEMTQVLFSLIDNWEEEIIEFKEAGKNSFKLSEIGQYFSAISNEANLQGLQYGWLIFGVRNKDRKIVGSDYRNTQGLNTLKNEIASNTTGGISFIGVYEVYPVIDGEKKRVIMFQIPAAVTAIPTGWHNIEYGRDGESLVPLSPEKRERIRRQEKMDWSKQIVAGATMEDLDKQAIMIARENYKERMRDSHISEEVDRMSDEEFLERRKLVINGNITNGAFLLLGNADYDYKFPTVPEASWRIYDSKERSFSLCRITTCLNKIRSKCVSTEKRSTTNSSICFTTMKIWIWQRFICWIRFKRVNGSVKRRQRTCANTTLSKEELPICI